MITDRELDAQLAGAALVDDADLPALPDEFLGLLRRSAAGADAPASVIAAGQLVADAHDARAATRPGRPPRHSAPRRRPLLRLGAAVLAVAAAWTTAVLVAPRDAVAPPGAVSPPPGTSTPTATAGTPGTGLTLVAAEAVTFPLSLDPPPEGLTPTFSRWGGTAYDGDQPLVFSADYSAAAGDRVLLRLFPEDPRAWGDAGWSVEGAPVGTATVGGVAADVREGDGYVTVLWERPDGRWVQVLGEGAHADPAAVVAVADHVVDRPQPVGLQLGLAPAGWSVGGYEESRSLDLVSDADPTRSPLRVSLLGGPGYDVTIDEPFEGRSLTGPVEPVTVQGRPARIAVTTPEDGDGWLVSGQLPGGPLFLVVAPPVLTREQVLQIAEQITYTP